MQKAITLLILFVSLPNAVDGQQSKPLNNTDRQSAETSGAPEIVFETTVNDFGKVFEGLTLRHIFEFLVLQ